MFMTAEEAIVFGTAEVTYRSPPVEARVRSTRAEVEHSLDMRSKVQAVLGRFTREEQAVAILWARGLSFRKISRELDVSDRTVRRLWDKCWGAIVVRLEAAGVVQR